MSRPESPGALFRRALAEESPLQIIGAINANHALLAKRAGYRAILSGGGVAAGSLGLPDLGINTMDDVLTDVRRITDVRRAAAGRHRHRLRSVGLQHRPHGQEPDRSARPPATSRTRSAPSAAATVPARKSSAPRKWPTA